MMLTLRGMNTIARWSYSCDQLKRCPECRAERNALLPERIADNFGKGLGAGAHNRGGLATAVGRRDIRTSAWNVDGS